MPSNSKPYVPFSQRTGLAPTPPQLRLGEVSADLRRVIIYLVSREMEHATRHTGYSYVFKPGWDRVATDLHVRFFKRSYEGFKQQPDLLKKELCAFIGQADLGALFDFIEFLLRHSGCGAELKLELAEAFVTERAAYRAIDNRCIAAIGTEEQAAAFQRAIEDAEANDAAAARKQLVAAGVALKNSDWAGCVRQSIHAVEAVAVRLAPGTDTLGAALKALEQRGHLHGSLKVAFGALYGYSSDEEGVRHALVFGDEAKVDEADALFMLGACASFVSYLLARST